MSELDRLFNTIRNHGEIKCIFYNNHEYSYIDILNKSYDLARYLESFNQKKIFFNLKNSPLSICIYLASWIANIDLLVPINPRLIDSELQEVLEGNSIFMTDKESCLQYENFKKLHIDDEIQFLNDLPKTDNYKIYSKVVTAHVSSGTTGMYKKHNHSVLQIVNYAFYMEGVLGLQRSDNLLVALSMNHAYAFSYQLLPALVMGLDLNIVSQFEASKVIDIINNKKITALALLPTMYHFLTKENISKSNSLRYLGVAGDITSDSLKDTVKKVFDLDLFEGIGMTEVFGYGQNIDYSSNNIVKIFDNTQVKIDKFKGSDYGKIFIKNPTLPLNLETEWLETGDIGSFDEDTHKLKFYGRYKDIIIKGGSNISPIEIETAILDIDNVSNCVVVGKCDKIWGEKICAFIVSNKEFSLENLNRHLYDYISDYKKVDQITFVKDIPITSTGKVDRKRLKELANNEH